MASVVLYFQVHQPFRLRRYTVFDTTHFYFDTQKNGDICRKVANKCYRPATSLMLDLVKRHKGNFRISYAITGVVLDQLAEFAPDVLDLFKRLAETGCCEFIGETYYHSLSFLYSREEFTAQVDLHTKKIQELFGQTPKVFRNTELTYNNEVAQYVASMKAYGAAKTDAAAKPRFMGILSEGWDPVLGGRSPNFPYRPPHTGIGATGRPFTVLTKNYRLSDDIAFRFGNRGWNEWPLTAEKFAGWVNQINGNGHLCNLFMDYETFGEHQWDDTGIFKFLDAMPEKVFDANPGHNDFCTPSEAIERYDTAGVYDVPHMISWADTERDLSAWLGNSMQSNALQETYRLERAVKQRLAAAEKSGDAHELAEARYLLDDWRKLTTSDHFYYMSTKYWADGDVHKYFSPYDSPYDAYINFMNTLDNTRTRAAAKTPVPH
ncbi:MAG: polysaccharide deacetylase family protein [Phycisphaerales bacterium]|nr:polysaccharide deacetylase family protein [Phycisphaerales bacterium]